MIFVLRHGERADDNGPRDDIEKSFDPHLTDHGKEQAGVSGLALSKLIDQAIADGLIKNPNPEIVIVSSPYLRCLETAAGLLPGLQKYKLSNKTIYADDGIAEFQGEVFFDSAHMHDLHYRSKSEVKELKKLHGIKIKNGFLGKNQHSIVPIFPEIHKEFFERAKTAFWTIFDHYQSVLNQNQDKVLILITHGFMTRAILGYNNNITSKGTEYCCISQLYYPQKNQRDCKVLLTLDYNHLLVLNAKPKL
jgi:broad specificity phosphatase PhoE